MIPATFIHHTNPALIARVIEIKPQRGYYAGEGFRVSPPVGQRAR